MGTEAYELVYSSNFLCTAFLLISYSNCLVRKEDITEVIKEKQTGKRMVMIGQD